MASGAQEDPIGRDAAAEQATQSSTEPDGALGDRPALVPRQEKSPLTLREVLDSALTGIIKLRLYPDGSFEYDYISPHCETIYGYRAEEMMPNGQFWRSHIHPDDWRDVIAPTMQAILAQERTATYCIEYRFQCKGGSTRWILANCWAQWHGPGGYWAVTVVDTDISRHKQMELSLKAREAQLKQAQAIARLGSWEFDLRTHQVIWSDELYRIHELDPTSAPLHPPDSLQFLHPDDIALHETQIVPAVKQGQAFAVDLRILTQGGNLRHVEARGEPIFDQAGDLACFVGTVLDITERKQAEEARRHREKLLDLFFSQSLDGFFFLMLDRPIEWNDTVDQEAILDDVFASGHVTYINDAMLAQYGATREQFLGWTLTDFFAHDLESGRSMVRQVLEQGHLHVEADERKLDGTPFVSDGYYVCIYDDDGRVTGYFGVQHDITEQKRLELALRDSQARLSAVLDSTLAGVMKLRFYPNTTLEYDYISPHCEVTLGYSHAEWMTGLDQWRSHIHPHDWQTVVQPVVEQVLALRSEASYTMEYRFRRKDGSFCWLLEKCWIVWCEAGEYWDITSVQTDISDRKAAELALEQEVHRRQTLVDASFDGIVVLNPQGNVVEANHSFAAMLGYRLEEVLRLNVSDWEAQMSSDELASCQESTRSTATFETRNRRHDGTVIDVEICCNRVEWEGEVLRFCICRDISDRKRIEAEHRAAETMLQQREQEFRALAENAPDAIIRCDRQFRFLYANPMVATITGIPRNHFLGKTLPELGFSDDLATRWQEAIEQVWITGEERFLQHELQTVQGTVGFYDVRFAPEMESDGSVVSVLGICRDITALKTAQNTLLRRAEREHSLRLITQQIRATLDLDDILTTAVTEVQRLLQADRTLIFRFSSPCSGTVIQEAVRPGYPTLLNMSWEDHDFPPERYAAYDQGDAQIIPAHPSSPPDRYLTAFKQLFQFQSKIVAPIIQSQENEPVVLWGLLIVHACGEPRHWHPDEADLLQQVADQLAIALQQSELYSQVHQLNTNLEQQVQERTADLQQSLEFEQLLRRLTDQVRDSLDENQILATVVQELAQGLQLECCDTGIYNADRTTSTIAYECTASLQPALGCTFTIADSPYPDAYTSLFQGLSCQFCNGVPNAFRRDQQRLTILACPIRDERENLGDIWLFKRSDDVFNPVEVRLVQQVANQCAIALRQSRLYQAAQAQVEELERLNQLKDDFLSTVSHELRTPISNVKMAIHMLEISLQPSAILDDTAQRPGRYFQILKRECQRELQLINDLLDLAHLEAGAEPLQRVPVDLRVLVLHLAESFIERTQQQQQHLVLAIAEDLPLYMTDRSDFERIVTELLNNACKYTPAGEYIHLSLYATASHFKLEVSNSGVTLPATECDRIFEKFYRIPSNDPWKHGGTGLGLALVKKLAERLGGTICVESGDRQITFSLELQNSGAMYL